VDEEEMDQLDYAETLVGIAALAVSLAGFTGVVVAFGSRSRGSWHAGDRLRLEFLLEASLTAGGFALVGLVLYHSLGDALGVAWAATSGAWAAFMGGSLYSSRARIRANLASHGDIDTLMNRVVFVCFLLSIVLQIVNVLHWHAFSPLLAALCLNLAGAAMQFTRLIRSAFHA
jgi:hypothetical protein